MPVGVWYERPCRRVAGNRRDSVDGAGWEMLIVAVDDHAPIAFTAMQPDEKQESANSSARDLPLQPPPLPQLNASQLVPPFCRRQCQATEPDRRHDEY